MHEDIEMLAIVMSASKYFHQANYSLVDWRR